MPTDPCATAANYAYVMRLVEMGQLRIGPGNQINRQAVFRLLGFDRPEAEVAGITSDSARSVRRD